MSPFSLRICKNCAQVWKLSQSLREGASAHDATLFADNKITTLVKSSLFKHVVVLRVAKCQMEWITEQVIRSHKITDCMLLSGELSSQDQFIPIRLDWCFSLVYHWSVKPTSRGQVLLIVSILLVPVSVYRGLQNLHLMGNWQYTTWDS